jgi:hypothetical protein
VKGQPLLEKAKTVDHGTPAEIWEVVQKAFGGPIDLDPCGNPCALLVAERTIWLPSCTSLLPDCFEPGGAVVLGDGLKEEWTGDVYVNPPYGYHELAAFMEKSVESAAAGASVIMLAPSKTGLKCWQRYVPKAKAVCFVNHRITFLGSKDPALFDCALILWTEETDLVDRFHAELDPKVGQVMFNERRIAS